jgi:hypothetical protein
MSLVDKKLILLDTNTLLVFLVSLLPKNLFSKFSKTKQYTKFQNTILFTISGYDQIVSNSYIFSEVSHLSIENNDFPEQYSQYLLEIIKKLIETNQLKIVETAIVDIVNNQSINYLGFNDVSILESPLSSFALLTFDQKLKIEAYKNHDKIDVIEI